MSNSEDKLPKLNGVGAADPMQRLASLKAPRDLSLGGAKPNKKVFIPNLNVARNKNKGPISTNPRDHKKDDKSRQDRKNNKRNNNRNGPNVIKSAGVFSEGLGSAERVASRNYYGKRDSESTPTLQKPAIRVKDVIKIDKELEEQKIRSAFGELGNLDEEGQDFKQVNEQDAPIKLPMDDGVTSVTETKPVVDVKKEVFEDTDVVNILRSEEPKMILLQLPDSLPGRGGSTDDDAPRRKRDEPSTSSGEPQEEKPVDNRCRLENLEEGRIGKLRIHQSGRVTLALGDTIFEVCSGTKASFHQEVVSIAADEASRSANLVALGPLQHKLNVAPDWETMFAQLPL
ncbi:DNA-directed RNA polymerase III subunit RPC4 isoform X2 [Ostrinia furnacalis]|uniref:DNA-directed RNA polymerase III subunit RPC4 isoform X2 n=1 Tax=Ostrinia furnacalis TaxID=93504 RepID=UPI00103E013A|nr:DNA-directed RNA polymerase III subunit RPC4 isoform X2 [Ostrinia furnacalis]